MLGAFLQTPIVVAVSTTATVSEHLTLSSICIEEVARDESKAWTSVSVHVTVNCTIDRNNYAAWGLTIVMKV